MMTLHTKIDYLSFHSVYWVIQICHFPNRGAIIMKMLSLSLIDETCKHKPREFCKSPEICLVCIAV